MDKNPKGINRRNFLKASAAVLSAGGLSPDIGGVANLLPDIARVTAKISPELAQTLHAFMSSPLDMNKRLSGMYLSFSDFLAAPQGNDDAKAVDDYLEKTLKKNLLDIMGSIDAYRENLPRLAQNKGQLLQLTQEFLKLEQACAIKTNASLWPRMRENLRQWLDDSAMPDARKKQEVKRHFKDPTGKTSVGNEWAALRRMVEFDPQSPEEIKNVSDVYDTVSNLLFNCCWTNQPLQDSLRELESQQNLASLNAVKESARALGLVDENDLFFDIALSDEAPLPGSLVDTWNQNLKKMAGDIDSFVENTPGRLEQLVEEFTHECPDSPLLKALQKQLPDFLAHRWPAMLEEARQETALRRSGPEAQKSHAERELERQWNTLHTHGNDIY